tara:strand:- start:103 stop:282 length:180 start_codon:yes stop_codon:yes gene_type:complete
MKIYNYIKDNICEPVEADNRRQADSMFISGFKVEVDEMIIDNDKDQFKFDFYVGEDMLQ